MLVAPAVLLALGAAFPAQEAALPEGFEEAAATIKPADPLKPIVGFLASDELQGRDTPSPGLDRAADWLAAWLKEAGLGPAFGRSWFQGPHRGDAAHSSGQLLLNGRKVDLGPEAFLSAGHEALDGRRFGLVVAPLPGKRSEVPPAELAGGRAVLLLSRKAGSSVVRRRQLVMALRWLRRAEAAAVLLPPGLPVDPERWRAAEFPVLQAGDSLPDLEPPAQPRLAEGSRLTLHVPLSQDPMARNVGAVLVGRDPAAREQVIAFTAHYDHIGTSSRGRGDRIFNGADDNASGTAGVLALARAFATLPRPPRRSVLFLLFYGEEKGFLGSRYYCRNPAFPLERTRAVFNLEMLGRPDDIEPGTAWITGWRHSDFGPLIARSGKLAGVRFYKHPRLSAMLFGASDNKPFADRGVVAHSISAGSLHEDYHKPGDEASKISYTHMARVVRGLFAAGAVMAEDGKLPSWKEGSPYARNRGSGRRGGR